MSKKPILVTTALFVAIAFAAYAEGEPQNCAKIEDNDARLSCYDEAFATAPTHATAPENWTVLTHVDELTDEKYETVSTTSLKPTRCGQRKEATFGFSCGEKRLIAGFTHSCYTPGQPNAMGRYRVRIDYRIDDNPAVFTWHEPIPSGDAFFTATTEHSIEWLRQLKGAEKLIVRFSTPSSTETMSFNVSNLNMALEEVLERCPWLDMLDSE